MQRRGDSRHDWMGRDRLQQRRAPCLVVDRHDQGIARPHTGIHASGRRGASQQDGRAHQPARQRLRDDESPCFPITHIELRGVEDQPRMARQIRALDGPQGDDAPIGRGRGARGSATRLTRRQDAVVRWVRWIVGRTR